MQVGFLCDHGSALRYRLLPIRFGCFMIAEARDINDPLNSFLHCLNDLLLSFCLIEQLPWSVDEQKRLLLNKHSRPLRSHGSLSAYLSIRKGVKERFNKLRLS